MSVRTENHSTQVEGSVRFVQGVVLFQKTNLEKWRNGDIEC